MARENCLSQLRGLVSEISEVEISENEEVKNFVQKVQWRLMDYV